MAIKRTKKTKKNPMSSARRGARSVARQSQGKLCEVAIEKLLVDPDPHTILSATEDLAAIRALAGRVMR